MVFFISAIFHEVLVGVPLHMLRLWAFWGLMLQVRGRGVPGQRERVLLLLGQEHGRCLGGLLAAQRVCEQYGRAGIAGAAPSNGSPGLALGQPDTVSFASTHGSPACCTRPTTQVPLMILSEGLKARFKSDRVGNVVFWVSPAAHARQYAWKQPGGEGMPGCAPCKSAPLRCSCIDPPRFPALLTLRPLYTGVLLLCGPASGHDAVLPRLAAGLHTPLGWPAHRRAGSRHSQQGTLSLPGRRQLA